MKAAGLATAASPPACIAPRIAVARVARSGSGLTAWDHLCCQPPRLARAAIRAVCQASKAAVGTDGVTLQFSVPFKAEFGEGLRVVGSHEALACWDVASAPQLTWSEGNVWVGSVELPAGTELEYKLVYDSRSGLQWEEFDGNRRLVVAAANGGSLPVECVFNQYTTGVEAELQRQEQDDAAGPVVGAGRGAETGNDAAGNGAVPGSASAKGAATNGAASAAVAAAPTAGAAAPVSQRTPRSKVAAMFAAINGGAPAQGSLSAVAAAKAAEVEAKRKAEEEAAHAAKAEEDAQRAAKAEEEAAHAGKAEEQQRAAKQEEEQQQRAAKEKVEEDAACAAKQEEEQQQQGTAAEEAAAETVHVIEKEAATTKAAAVEAALVDGKEAAAEAAAAAEAGGEAQAGAAELVHTADSSAMLQAEEVGGDAATERQAQGREVAAKQAAAEPVTGDSAALGVPQPVPSMVPQPPPTKSPSVLAVGLPMPTADGAAAGRAGWNVTGVEGVARRPLPRSASMKQAGQVLGIAALSLGAVVALGAVAVDLTETAVAAAIVASVAVSEGPSRSRRTPRKLAKEETGDQQLEGVRDGGSDRASEAKKEAAARPATSGPGLLLALAALTAAKGAQAAADAVSAATAASANPSANAQVNKKGVRLKIDKQKQAGDSEAGLRMRRQGWFGGKGRADAAAIKVNASTPKAARQPAKAAAPAKRDRTPPLLRLGFIARPAASAPAGNGKGQAAEGRSKATGSSSSSSGSGRVPPLLQLGLFGAKREAEGRAVEGSLGWAGEPQGGRSGRSGRSGAEARKAKRKLNSKAMAPPKVPEKKKGGSVLSLLGLGGTRNGKPARGSGP